MGFSIKDIILFFIMHVHYLSYYVFNAREFSSVNSENITINTGRCGGANMTLKQFRKFLK